MKFVSIAIMSIMVLQSSAIERNYPYQTVSKGKQQDVIKAGGKPELEPLETGNFKSLDSKFDMKKFITRDGFKEKPADRDSVEERIKWGSRNFGNEEATKIQNKLKREKGVIRHIQDKAYELGIR